MKKRIFYIISFLVIFCIEVLIALYVRDRFIRPYVGDMLVVDGDSADAVLCLSFCLFRRSVAILPAGGNIGCHEPRSPNCAGFYVRLGRYCLLCCGMRFHCLIRVFRPA